MKTASSVWFLGALTPVRLLAPTGAIKMTDTKAASRMHPRQGAIIEPIYYVHVPKTGSPIENTIAHFVCNSSFPRQTVNKCRDGFPDRCGAEHFARFGCERGHPPMDEDAPLSKAVVMFREPKTRMLSGYFHKLHDCERLWPILNFPPAARWAGQYNWSRGVVHRRIFREYKRCVDGCVAKMLTDKRCEAALPAADLTERARTAVAKITHLGFVGLTEHMELSVCLWHAMFGGSCHPFEFQNTRPGNLNNGQGATIYNESTLSVFGNSSLIDQPIYDEAKLVFFERLEIFGVTPDTCAKQICPRAAHHFKMAA